MNKWNTLSPEYAYDPDKAYDITYLYFSTGILCNSSIRDVQKLFFKLNLEIKDILVSAVKHNHINFLKYILDYSLDFDRQYTKCARVFEVCNDRYLSNDFERSPLLNSYYFSSMEVAVENHNIEILNILINFFSEPNVKIKLYENGFSVMQLKQLIHLGKFFIELLECKKNNRNLDSIGDTAYMYIKDKYLSAAALLSGSSGQKDFLEYIFNFTTNPGIRYQILHGFSNYYISGVVHQYDILSFSWLFRSLFNGNQRHVKAFNSIEHRFLINDPFKATVDRGHIVCLKYLLGLLVGHRSMLSTILGKGLLYRAASKGHLEIFKFLFEQIPDTYKDEVLYRKDGLIYRCAAKSGNLEFLEYLVELKPKKVIKEKLLGTNNPGVFLSAVGSGGAIEVLKYLMSFLSESKDILKVISYSNYEMFFNAVKLGRLDVVKYIVELFPDNINIQDMVLSGNYRSFKSAVKLGHVEILKFLTELLLNHQSINDINISISKLTKIFKNLLESAAESGDVDVYRYLLEVYPEKKEIHKLNYNNIFVTLGNGSGDVDLVKYLIELDSNNKTVREIFRKRIMGMSTSYFTAAAHSGEVDLVKYLIELCSKHKDNHQLLRVNINELIWLPFVDRNYDYASVFEFCPKKGHFKLMDYILEISNSNSLIKKAIKNSRMFETFAKKGQIRYLNRLLEFFPDQKSRDYIIHKEYDQAFVLAAKNGHLEVLKYLVELTPDDKLRKNMIHADENCAFATAVASGDIDVMNYIIELTPDYKSRNTLFYQSVKGFQMAACTGRLDSLKFVSENAPELIVKMLKDNCFNAFILAAKFGRVDSMEYLIGLSENVSIPKKNSYKALKSLCIPEGLKEKLLNYNGGESEYNVLENFKDQMIHAKNDHAFRLAVRSNQLDSVHYLLDIVQDSVLKKKMIHSNNDEVFKISIEKGYTPILELLLESCLDHESNDKIIYPALEEAVENKDLVKYLGDIESSVDWSFLNFS